MKVRKINPMPIPEDVAYENMYRFHFFGLRIGFQYHDLLIPLTFILRLSMGWIFLWAGFDKLFNDFSAAGFLVNGTSGPFESTWVSLGKSDSALAVIDPLVIWGQIAIGFALILGAAIRLTLILAAAMMFLFYLAQFPPEHDLFMDYFIIYIIVYMVLGAVGAGRIMGLDKVIKKTSFVQKHKWLRYFLG